jgi:hypothetical protein
LKFQHAVSLPFDADSDRVESKGSHDTTFAQIFVSGDRSMSLISRDGDVLCQQSLPSSPIAQPMFGDFDSDGVTDVIFVTDEAMLGFKLVVQQSPQAMLIAVLILAGIAAIGFFASIRTVSVVDSGGSSLLSASKKSVLTITRATDEYHID